MWRPIDNRLEPSSAGGYAHENGANAYDLQLPRDLGARPVRVAAGGAWVSFALEGAHGVGTVSRNAKTYRTALPNTDVRMSALSHGVKEDLVLHSAKAPNTFRYALQTSTGLSARLNGRGGFASRCVFRGGHQALIDGLRFRVHRLARRGSTLAIQVPS
jgi:hypothetical protein